MIWLWATWKVVHALKDSIKPRLTVGFILIIKYACAIMIKHFILKKRQLGLFHNLLYLGWKSLIHTYKFVGWCKLVTSPIWTKYNIWRVVGEGKKLLHPFPHYNFSVIVLNRINWFLYKANHRNSWCIPVNYIWISSF